MRWAWLAVGLIVTLHAVQCAAQATDAELTVIDEAGKVHTLAAADLAKLPQQTLKAKAHGMENEFGGVSLVDVLQSVGVEFGDKLKGKRAGTVLVVEAGDGYRTAFALLEIDPATTDKVVLLASSKDGQPLAEKEGPLRLVVPDEKRPIRWERMVKTMRVLNVKDLPLVENVAPKAENKQP
jgi:hypothetical protein